MPRVSKSDENMNFYSSNGVMAVTDKNRSGKEIKLRYDGILNKSGANEVYAQVGYGSDWDNKQFYKMDKGGQTFEVSIPVIESDVMNVCFKDSANNWDNNSGINYSFTIN